MNRFALKIACLSAFAYIFPVITATYADSHIHHVVYGTRHYEMGYLVAIGFVLPFFFAYMFNRDNNKSFFSKISGSARRGFARERHIARKVTDIISKLVISLGDKGNSPLKIKLVRKIYIVRQ